MPNYRRESLKVKFDPSQLIDKLDQIEAVSATATRKAAQTGAEVLYQEVLRNVPVGKDEFHWFYGKNQRYLFRRGSLKRAIYQAFSEDRSVEYTGSNKFAQKQSYEKATYHVSWRHKDNAGGPGAPYGFMVEFGTSRAPAHPFLYPSFDLAKKPSLEAARDVWTTAVRAVL